MTTTKKSAPKKKNTVKLVSYTFSATIPTAPYANITPTVTVQASTIEEAHAYCMTHIQALINQYRETERPEIKAIKTEVQKTVKKETETAKEEIKDELALPEGASEHFKKVHTIIVKASKITDKEQRQANLTELDEKIKVSKKLTEDEKETLSTLILNIEWGR